LITHRFAIEQGEEAYALFSGETKEPYLGIVLQYDPNRELQHDCIGKGSVNTG